MKSFFIILERVAENDIITSREIIISIGIIANDSGISALLTGAAAISEISIVETSSEISSSPICLLPVSLIASTSSMYIMQVRITQVVMV